MLPVSFQVSRPVAKSPGGPRTAVWEPLLQPTSAWRPPLLPLLSRCRHLLTEVLRRTSGHFLQLAFCRTVKSKRDELKCSQTIFYQSSKSHFLIEPCLGPDLRGSVHSGLLGNFSLLHPILQDLPCKRPEPPGEISSPWHFSDSSPPGLGVGTGWEPSAQLAL